MKDTTEFGEHGVCLDYEKEYQWNWSDYMNSFEHDEMIRFQVKKEIAKNLVKLYKL